VQIKDCLTIYTPRALGQVKMTFISVLRKANYTRVKAYNPISLMPFMKKPMLPLDKYNCFLTTHLLASHRESLSGIHSPAVEPTTPLE